MSDLGQAKQKWVETRYEPEMAKLAGAQGKETTLARVKRRTGSDVLLTPADVKIDYEKDLGFPGEYPFTRGVYPAMHTGQPWVMRQIVGFGTAEESNQRFRYLLEHGETGLTIVFSQSTIMGLDSDDPMAEGEVGRSGLPVDTIEDMKTLLQGMPLDKIHVAVLSSYASSPALFGCFVAAAEELGFLREQLFGSVQNHMLGFYVALPKCCMIPPEAATRLVADAFEFCGKQMPRFAPINVTAHIVRESAAFGSARELAMCLAFGITYVESAVRRGIDVDLFAPRMAFYMSGGLNLLGEVAKFRAARRMWATIMRERFGAKNPRSWLFRTHCQTSAYSTAAKDPLANIVRGTIGALAGVLGGAQSVNVTPYDEAYNPPTEEAVRLALRTNQVLYHETDLADTIDPFGGSYYIEQMTTKLEAEATKRLDEIAAMGGGSIRDGVIKGIHTGEFVNEVARSRHLYQEALERGERVFVGENAFIHEEESHIQVFEVKDELEEKQCRRVQAVRASRDPRRVAETLKALMDAAEDKGNIIEATIECARARVTVGEMTQLLVQVFGEYHATFVLP